MRKKKTAFIVCVVLILSLLMGTVSTAYAITDAECAYVRVKLSVGAPAAITFTLSGSYYVNGLLAAPNTYTLKLEGGVLNLYLGDVNSAILLPGGGASVAITHTATTFDNNIKFVNGGRDGHTYLGDMTFGIEGAGISAINRVYLDDYILGVIPYEMMNSWDIDALKAQAIASRSYVTNYFNPGAAYDVVDTSARQVYDGYNAAYTNSIDAVNQTAKLVLKSDGAIIQGFFGASNGGYTEIPQHVWSAGNPVLKYHVIKADDADTRNPESKSETLVFPKTFNETERITYKRYKSASSTSANAETYMETAAFPALQALGYIADINEIKIVGISSMVPKTVSAQHTVAGYSGSIACPSYTQADVTMTVNALRYVASDGVSPMAGDVNFDGTVSVSDYTLVRLHILGIKPLSALALKPADVDVNGAVNIQDYTAIRLDILGLKDIPNGTAYRENVAVTFPIDYSQLDVGGAYASYTLSLNMFTLVETPTGFELYNRRWGSGIGLSQRGAEQRANEGQSYLDILTFYYPNCELYSLVIAR